MPDSREPKTPQPGILDEEELVSVGSRNFLKGFGYQRISGFHCCAGYLGNDCSRLVLQLLAVTLFSAGLLATLVQVSRSPSFQELEQEQSNQEKINQELKQLQAIMAKLCRPCPWEWTFFQRKCYFFSKSQRNWHDSVTACEEEGARLVIVESADEQSFLQLSSTRKGRTWMGLSDLNNESTWHWVDGSPLSLSFMKYWNPNEPNNLGEEDCAEFYGDGWNDTKCNATKYFICKQSAASCSN